MNIFNNIEENGNTLLFQYIRGSHLYNLNTETSDIDYGGVFICPKERVLGFNYIGEIADERHDEVYYEIGNFFNLITFKSNATTLESLFVPKEKYLYLSPLMDRILEHRDEFLSKKCFGSYGQYAIQQINKMQGLNKKCVQKMEKRLDITDFMFVQEGYGSKPLKVFLDEYGLDQKYIGLSKITNMNSYAMFYDFAAHRDGLGCSMGDIERFKKVLSNSLHTSYTEYGKDIIQALSYHYNIAPIGYRGIAKINPNKESIQSNELRLSSIPKDQPMIGTMQFNANEYVKHCKEYLEYKEWEKNRNQQRYKENKDKTYDSKNAMHCFRLMEMCIEIAKGQGVNLDRTHEREFLLKVKAHGFEYSELKQMIDEKRKEMEDAIKHSTIREEIDSKLTEKLLIDVREKFYYGRTF